MFVVVVVCPTFFAWGKQLRFQHKLKNRVSMLPFESAGAGMVLVHIPLTSQAGGLVRVLYELSITV